MPFDVGAITRELQTAFRLFVGVVPTRPDVLQLELTDDGGAATNRATPENLQILLRALRRLTGDMSKARAEMSNLIPDAGLIAWNLSFAAWQMRLAKYESDVAKAPKGNRASVLWSVTAPLLLGFYGGEHSEEPQRVLDAITPFSLANQLQIAEEWRTERWRLFQTDLAKAFKDAAAIGGGLVVVAVVVVGALLLTRGRR